MRSVTVEEAQTHLEELLREVESGVEIEIRRGDTTIAALSPVPSETAIGEQEAK